MEKREDKGKGLQLQHGIVYFLHKSQLACDLEALQALSSDNALLHEVAATLLERANSLQSKGMETSGLLSDVSELLSDLRSERRLILEILTKHLKKQEG